MGHWEEAGRGTQRLSEKMSQWLSTKLGLGRPWLSVPAVPQTFCVILSTSLSPFGSFHLHSGHTGILPCLTGCYEDKHIGVCEALGHHDNRGTVSQSSLGVSLTCFIILSFSPLCCAISPPAKHLPCLFTLQSICEKLVSWIVPSTEGPSSQVGALGKTTPVTCCITYKPVHLGPESQQRRVIRKTPLDLCGL